MTSVPRKRKVIGSACASMENGSVEGGCDGAKDEGAEDDQGTWKADT